MMININRFNGQIGVVKNEIKNYEMIIYDTISTAKNMSFYWNDGYTGSFFKKIEKEMQDTNDLVNCLYSILSFMNSLSAQYNDINDKRNYYFGYSSGTINSNSFIITSSDEEDVAEKKRQLYYAIMRAEDECAAMISRIKVPYIEGISFDNLDKENGSEYQGFIGMKDNMSDEIKKLEQKKEDAKATSDRLKNSLYSIAALYSSDNSRKISKIIDEVSDSFYSLNLNLTKASEYVKYRKEKYKTTFSELAKDIKNQANT